MRDPRLWPLALGLSASLLLVALAERGATGPLRVAAALVAVLFAPTYAALLLLPRRLQPVERAGLALAFGILLAPLVGLAVSATVGFRPLTVATAYLALNLGLLVTAMLARPAPTVPKWGARLAPSPTMTFALSGGALAVSALIFALPLLQPDPEPVALSILSEDRSVQALPSRVAPGESAAVWVRVDAGSEARAGRLVVHAVPLDESRAPVLVADIERSLAPGERYEVPLELPPLDRGEYRVEAAWLGEEERRVHLWLTVEGGR